MDLWRGRGNEMLRGSGSGATLPPCSCSTGPCERSSGTLPILFGANRPQRLPQASGFVWYPRGPCRRSRDLAGRRGKGPAGLICTPFGAFRVCSGPHLTLHPSRTTDPDLHSLLRISVTQALDWMQSVWSVTHEGSFPVLVHGTGVLRGEPTRSLEGLRGVGRLPQGFVRGSSSEPGLG